MLANTLPAEGIAKNMNKKLKKAITKKLEQLDKILEEIRNTSIDDDDSELWDPDYYYDLTEQLREALTLLEDSKSKEKNEFGESISEPGICSLIDAYAEEKEEDYE